MKNIYVKPEEKVVTNGTAQAPIPQVPIPTITYAQGGVPTVSGQPTNYGNLMGGGNSSVPPDMSNATIPEYYKYAYDVGMQNAERTRNNAVQNARAQYNQFINPYGAVANQQAQAGFTGGGYSQFLQGQAYQSMIDSQNAARATEAATKQTLYGDYLKGMADYNQKQQEKQDLNQKSAADLLNNIGTYSSLEAVNSALDALGITDETQRKTYTDAWTNQNQQNIAKNQVAFNTYISGNSEDGEPQNEQDIIAYAKALGLDENSAEVQNAITSFKQGQNYGKLENIVSLEGEQAEKGWEDFFGESGGYNTLNDEQKAEANKAFSDWLINNAFTDANGNVSAEGFFTDENGKAYTEEFARRKLQEELANPHYSQQLKNLIQAEFNNKYQGGKTDEQISKEASDLKQRNEIISNARNLNKDVEIKDDANVVNINSKTFSLTDFGKFNDSGTGKGEQDTYLKATIEGLKSLGKEAVGKIILPNYGKNKGDIDAYMYVGSGRFVKIEVDKYGWGGLDIFIPNGYENSTSIDAGSSKTGASQTPKITKKK
jgi:hypothetical protein